jgi:hypothetical protein
MPVAASNPFVRFYTFLAKMGLVIRDDPPKVIDMAGREWGEAVDGLVLSVRELPREDAGSVAGISVVMKNGGAEAKTLSVEDWTHYFEVENLELTPYGRMLFGEAGKQSNLTLDPGGAVEAELPIGRIYNVRSPGVYAIQVRCELPGEGRELRSNRIEIRV